MEEEVNKESLKKLDSLMPIVKFSNKMNEYTILQTVDKFDELENNIFFACIAQFYEQQEHRLQFSSSQIRELIGYKNHISEADFAKKIDHAFGKFLSLQDEIIRVDAKTGKKSYKRKTLFKESEVNEDLECYIQVNDGFVELFNNLGTWTRFSLLQYTHLHSMYSKRLYRLLKQYRTVGKRTFKIDDFREKLVIAKSYAPTNIDQRVFKPIKEELSSIFYGFKITKNYAKGKRGRKLESYTFTWRPETKQQHDISTNRVLEKTLGIYYIKKNPYLTEDEKFRAIDRYNGVRLGTTKKGHVESKNATFFTLPKGKNTPSSEFTRSDLEETTKYSISAIKSVIQAYERLNKDETLLSDDLEDLIKLELLLLKKELVEFKKKGISYKQKVETAIEKLYPIERAAELSKDQIRIDLITELYQQKGSNTLNSKLDTLF